MFVSMSTISETPHRRAGRPDEPALLRAARAHDGQGRAELVEAYMPLIGSVAHHYRGARAVNHTELMQEGVVGLLRAVDRGAGSALGEMLSDPAAQDPFEQIPSRDAAQRLGEVLVVLTDRERTILTEHYGLNGEPRTLRVIAAGLGVSAERVRQIEQGALDKLRESCDAAG